MAFTLTKQLVILCEGAADQVFFKKLLDIHDIFDFDIPPHGKHHGWSGTGHMLRSLAGDASAYKNLKGVLIIADNANETTFADICEKIEEHGPFEAPERFARPHASNQIEAQSEVDPENWTGG
jgi:hypothetical protein